MTLAEIRAMPAADFMRFWASYKIEPFGELREDIRTAQTCQWLAVVAGDQRRLPLKPFLIDWWKAPPTPEEAEAYLVRKIEAAFGGGEEGGPDG